MTIIPFIIIALTIFLAYKDICWGAIVMIVVRTIVPPIVRVGPISLNSAIIVVLMLFLVHGLFLNKSLRNTYIHSYSFPISSLIIPLVMLGCVALIPLQFQLTAMLQFVLTEILPFFVLLYSIRNEKDLTKVIYCFAFSYIIIGLYGIATYFMKFNPLYTSFSLFYGIDQDLNFSGDGLERLRGAFDSSASGNMSGPLPWGQFSLLVLLLAMFVPGIKNRYLKIGFIVVAILNCFLCTKRSIILPMLLILFYYLYVNRLFDIKKIIYLVIGVFVFVSFFDVSKYWGNIESALFFWDDSISNKYDIGGSSSEMRTEQLLYSFRMIYDYPLQGLGYGYPGYYFMKYGKHPIMLGFESIIFQVLVCSGVLGLCIWFLFFKKSISFSYIRSLGLATNYCVHGTYILSLLLTGIQASFFMYLSLIAIMYKNEQFSLNHNTRL